MDDHQFRDGAKAALPIVLGYLPVGMAFGILAQKAGLTAFEAGLMSLLVYAGASQFIAVEMISKGIIWFPIVLTTFFINFRHLLMSSTLSLFFNKNSLRILGLLSAQLTDESFAVAMSDTSKILNRPKYLLGLQMTSQLAWITGSVGGAFFGSLIDHKGYGLPFALPALFICLLVLQIKSPNHFWMMGIAGISSLLFRWAFPGSWYILLATLLASGIGVTIEIAGKRER
jgi:4-azaleucine resistance transporter AzlC